jgi:hypothetical protein
VHVVVVGDGGGGGGGGGECVCVAYRQRDTTQCVLRAGEMTCVHVCFWSDKHARQLRPEFVRNWTRAPLCSDAFTRWLDADPDRAALTQVGPFVRVVVMYVCAQNVVAATHALYEKTIPNFASEITSFLPPLRHNETREQTQVLQINHQVRS